METFLPLVPMSVPDTDRIWRNETGGYNQVIALTQWMINTGIQNFHKYVKGDLKPVTYAPNPSESISNATFGPPAVMIEASTSNFTSVKLNINLQSATAKIIQRFESASDANNNTQILETAYLTLKNMYVVVPCNIDFVHLDKTTDRGKEMTNRMKAGDHSIYQLLVDLTSAAWGDAIWDYGVWSENDTVVVSGDSPPPAPKPGDPIPPTPRPDGWVLGEKRDRSQLGAQLVTHMEAMFKPLARQLTEKGMLTMNYTKSFDHPTLSPTFDVNNTRLQTYPWVDAGNNPVAAGITGPGRLNYLCYLDTVGANTPPAVSDTNAILTPFASGARRGNWTDGVDTVKDSPSKFGNFVLSSTCFLEGYFLPKLENLNRLMRLDIDQVYCTIDAHFAGWKTSTYYEATIGKEYSGANVESSPNFRFTRSTFKVGDDWDIETKSWFMDWTQGDLRLMQSLPRGTLEYNWSWVQRHEKDQDQYKHTGSVEEWTYGQTLTKTRVLIVPGTSKIFYHGKSWTRIDYKIDPSTIEHNVKGGFILTAKWHIIFTMTEASTGSLKIDIDASNIDVNVYWNAKGANNDWPDGIKDQYANAGRNFEYVVNGLRTALNKTNTFVMPSSGVYFFKNPIFNHNGDLICELEYNNIGDDGSLPTNKNAVPDPQILKPDWLDFTRSVKVGGELFITED